MDRDLKMVLEKVKRVTDFDARLYRKSTLKRRVDSRIRATRSKNYRNYLIYLKRDPSEYARFLEALTINVTDFFRDKNVFNTLKKKILPEIVQSVKDKNKKYIRMWSIGCSKGQEPYSLAILVREILEGRKDHVRIIIHATDMNKASLKQAKAALYSDAEVHNVPLPYLKKYFQNDGQQYRLRQEVRELVRFKEQDLIRGNSSGKFHLILCRNLFIFFEPQLQERMLKKIYASLKEDGFLVLGKAESPSDESLFQSITAQDHIYKKRAKPRPEHNR